jgi:predicted ATPase
MAGPQELRRRLKGVESVEPASEFAAVPRGNIRELPTSFFGRQHELRALEEWFEAGDRVVTLLGPAGCGKTRVAKRYAAVHGGDCAAGGGTWFCDLTEASDVPTAVACVARALGIPIPGGGERDPAETVGRVLAAGGPTLLLLDNCEQAAPDIAKLLARWRDAAPQLRFLATSRERLGVVGERVCDLAPLSLPQLGDDVASLESVQLFVDRARLVRPDYSVVDAEEASIVGAIVRALDGLPLAIELAAARMGLMSARMLLSRLDKRLELLADTGREPSGHRATLRAAIDWSWNLLEPAEQATLRQCAVFRGGFTVEAAEAIVDLAGVAKPAPVLEVVQRLRDKSLIHAHALPDHPSELRLGLYESIREYAAEKLAQSGEEGAVARRHAQYFVGTGAVWAAGAERGAFEDARKLDAEAENILAAHSWALANSPSEALRAAVLLDGILARRGDVDGALRVFERTLARAAAAGDADPGLRAAVHFRRGMLRHLLGAVGPARADAELASQLARTAGDPGLEGDALRLWAMVDAADGIDPEAHIGGALAAAVAASDLAREAKALTLLAAQVYGPNAEHERAIEANLRAIALAESVGDKVTVAAARGNLGLKFMDMGRAAEAESALEDATAAFQSLRDVHRKCVGTLNLAIVRQERGELERAEQAYRELLATPAMTCRAPIRGLALAMLGVLLAGRGDVREAGRLFDQAEATLAGAGARWLTISHIHRGHLDLALARDSARRGDQAASEKHRANAERRLADGKALPPSNDLSTARRWLEKALNVESFAWIIAEDGAWFRPPRGERIDVADRQHAKATLRALLEAWREAPGRVLGTDDVLASAWPGERIHKRAGASRVYVTIGRLRDLGLRGLILRVAGGYMLDPTQLIAVGARGAAERAVAPRST